MLQKHAAAQRDSVVPSLLRRRSVTAGTNRNVISNTLRELHTAARRPEVMVCPRPFNQYVGLVSAEAFKDASGASLISGLWPAIERALKWDG